MPFQSVFVLFWARRTSVLISEHLNWSTMIVLVIVYCPPWRAMQNSPSKVISAHIQFNFVHIISVNKIVSAKIMLKCIWLRATDKASSGLRKFVRSGDCNEWMRFRKFDNINSIDKLNWCNCCDGDQFDDCFQKVEMALWVWSGNDIFNWLVWKLNMQRSPNPKQYKLVFPRSIGMDFFNQANNPYCTISMSRFHEDWVKSGLLLCAQTKFWKMFYCFECSVD